MASPIHSTNNQAESVVVQLFAKAAELTGTRQMTLHLSDEETVGTLFRRIAIKHPELGELKASLRFAVNHEFCDDTRRLNAGDEIAVIPPVSGG